MGDTERRRGIFGIGGRGSQQSEFSGISVEIIPQASVHRILEFTLPHYIEAGLDKDQKQLFRFLVRAARRTAELYSLQESEDERGIFYPKDAAKTEVQQAAQTNPAISSPYTIVRRTPEGNLIAIPMHDFYADRLKEKDIPRLLREAAKVAGKGKRRDIQFQKYLDAKARALETGDYESSARLWLERDNESEIDIVLGPDDTYGDRFLGVKYAWQAWVGVFDKETTYNSQWFLDAFLKKWEEETGQNAPVVRMRIDHTRILAGQAALYEWLGNSLPCQQEWRQKYGSKFTIFKPIFERDFRKKKLVAFKSLIDYTIRRGVQDKFVKTVSLRRHIAHEISHSLGVAQDLEQRLQEFAAPIKELYCNLLALKGYFAIPGISAKERELAFATLFADGIIEYANFHYEGKREEYYAAASVLLNYCLQKGSVKEEDGRLTWDNPRQVMDDIISLFDEVHKIQIEDTVEEAEQFFRQYYNDDAYTQLRRVDVAIPHFLRKSAKKPPSTAPSSRETPANFTHVS